MKFIRSTASLCVHCSQTCGCETLLNGTVEQTDFGNIVQEADGNSGDGLAQGPRHAGVQLDQRLWVTWSRAVVSHVGPKLVPVKRAGCPTPLALPPRLAQVPGCCQPPQGSQAWHCTLLEESQVCLFLRTPIQQILERGCKRLYQVRTQNKEAKVQCAGSTATFAEGPRSLCSC